LNSVSTDPTIETGDTRIGVAVCTIDRCVAAGSVATAPGGGPLDRL